jgi:hypothetical protein
MNAIGRQFLSIRGFDRSRERIRACLGGLRLRLHERLHAKPSQTIDFATAPGVELPLEHLAASEGEAEPRFRGSTRLRPRFPTTALGWQPRLRNGKREEMEGQRRRAREKRGEEKRAAATPGAPSIRAVVHRFAPPESPKSRRRSREPAGRGRRAARGNGGRRRGAAWGTDGWGVGAGPTKAGSRLKEARCGS